MTSLNTPQQKQLSKQLGNSNIRPTGRFISTRPVNSSATSIIPVDQSGAIELSAALQQCSALRQQLSAQTHDLALATERADRLEQDLIQFVSATCHDLSNPLRAISGFSSLLAQDCDNGLSDKGKRYLDRIESGAERMKTLLDSLCDYARSSTITFQRNPTDLNIVVDNVLADLNEAARQANAVVTHDDLPVILADEVQLSHLMRHLIDNSLSFAGENQLQVKVSAQRIANQWQIKVQDNGRGISAKHIESAFMMFSRFDYEDNATGGTGAGLALCKQIAQRHGWEISIESKVNIGTTVTLFINADDTTSTQSN